MKLGGENNQKSYIRDLHNWNRSTLLGGGLILKIRKNDVFLTYEGLIGSS